MPVRVVHRRERLNVVEQSRPLSEVVWWETGSPRDLTTAHTSSSQTTMPSRVRTTSREESPVSTPSSPGRPSRGSRVGVMVGLGSLILLFLALAGMTLLLRPWASHPFTGIAHQTISAPPPEVPAISPAGPRAGAPNASATGDWTGSAEAPPEVSQGDEEARLERLHDAVERLEARITTLQADFSTLQRDAVERLDARITTLQEDFSTLQRDIASLRAPRVTWGWRTIAPAEEQQATAAISLRTEFPVRDPVVVRITNLRTAQVVHTVLVLQADHYRRTIPVIWGPHSPDPSVLAIQAGDRLLLEWITAATPVTPRHVVTVSVPRRSLDDAMRSRREPR